jgi:hypothetical protein
VCGLCVCVSECVALECVVLGHVAGSSSSSVEQCVSGLGVCVCVCGLGVCCARPCGWAVRCWFGVGLRCWFGVGAGELVAEASGGV